MLGQWTDGRDGLLVAQHLVEHDVHVEFVFPLAADDGQRLYLGEVDAVERQDAEHLRQAPLLVRQGEDHAGLVGFAGALAVQVVHLPGVRHDEEAREVVLVGLDALFQHLHAVELGGVLRADGSVPVEAVAVDNLCAEGGVLAFDDLDVRVAAQEVAALHQGDGV